MQIKLIVKNVLNEKTVNIENGINKYFVDINNEMTFFNLLNNVKIPNMDLSNYYELSKNIFVNSDELPYVIVNGKTVFWNVEYKMVLLTDFIATHNIENNTIYAKIGQPRASGREIKIFEELWAIFFDIVNKFKVISEFKTIIEDITSNKKKLIKKIPPHSFVDMIYSKEFWNAFELSYLLNIPYENTKMILKGLGYKYNKTNNIYIKTSDSINIQNSINKINIYKD